ncbi:MAG: hypothetical protein M3371_14060 [Acidobacteriota bacterium]|nr:hypothetical protein [Acidobacteriota bacterium]
MYQPNFCAECGAQVVRERRRVWDSRRFCAACAGRFRRARLLWPLLACAALLGIGFAAGRAVRPAAPPLVIARGDAQDAARTFVQQSATGGAAAQRAANFGAGNLTAQEPPTEPDEVVSICGARTKKGTPCSRRVRGTGRCWQHRGKRAMLPPEKLIVPND